MKETSRRTFLRSGVGAVCCGTTLLLTGCSLLQHHRPNVNIWNEDSAQHTVSVTVQRLNAETVFEKDFTLQPNESVDYSNALPRPSDTDSDALELETIVSLESGTSERQTDKFRQGVHGLDIHIVSADSIKIIQRVH